LGAEDDGQSTLESALGCAGVFIGCESLTDESANGAEM
jgi:hypothetical protein